MGCTVSLAQFSGGKASLKLLASNQIDTLKIDGSLIKNIAHCERSQNIFASIISLADNLDIPALVRRVESVEQHNYLQARHNIAAQGNFYAPPMTAQTYCEYCLSTATREVANS